MVKLLSTSLPVIDGKTLSAHEFIAYVARVSSTRKDKTKDPLPLIEYLIEHKHWSPFQHFYLTFEINTTRSIGRQILRHSSLDFQEFSQRFNSPKLEFHIPEFRLQHKDRFQCSTEEVLNDPALLQRIKDYYELGTEIYEEMLSKGIARECARDVLPESCVTTMICTGNLRSWIHFTQVREDEHAQKEIRIIAKEIREYLDKALKVE